MQRTHWPSRRVFVLLLAVIVAVSSGVALVLWVAGGSDKGLAEIGTPSGSGSGAAGTGAVMGLTVVQTSTNTGLYPGGKTELSGLIANPNSSSVAVTSVTASIAPSFSSRTDPTRPACTAGDFTLTGAATVASPVAANSTNGGAWSGLDLHLIDSGVNQDNCQNVTVPIIYTVQ